MKDIILLSLALAVCMLGGCTDKDGQSSVSMEDMGDISAGKTSSAVSESQTESFFVPESEPGNYEDPFGYQTLNYDEVKGIWISYIELAGLQSDTEISFRSSVADVFDNCVKLGLNTVFVHVRSHGDAFYNSELYPRTKYLGGSYDPLPIMIEEAHKRGLSFQAWINPLRCCSVEDIDRAKGYPMYEWAGAGLVEVDGYYYLNPAYGEVIELISEGAAELVEKYDVDGVHIDDYFYPTTDETFDRAAFEASSFDNLYEFRIANCDRLVSSLYNAVKSADSTALFGVSPQGNYLNNYAYMYADVEKWCTQSGYLDYIMPQIYFGFNNDAQPFSDVLRKWDSLASKGKIPLIVGLSPAKLGKEDSWGGDSGRYEWINDRDILKRQFIETSETVSYGGICLYSYNSIYEADSDCENQIDREISALLSAIR